MDIQRLRQILNELNPIFWNPEIDRQLEASDFPNHSLIESAKHRYTIALRKLVPRPNFLPCNKKSAPYRQMIIESRSSEKKRFNKLLEKVEECLSPYDKVFGVLLEGFTSPFAKQVLLTHQNLIEKFAGRTLDNYLSWTELLVCMSHEDFWADGTPTKRKINKEAYIPFTKALELSNGVLTRKKLEKAINDSDPMKVRSDKPSKNRCDVHIQDIIALIEKLSSNEEVTEKAVKMFATWKDLDIKKRPQANLE